MITNAVLMWFGKVVGFLINLLPDAPLVVPSSTGFGAGVAEGTRCCAQVILGTVIALFHGIPNPSAGGVPIGSIATLLSFSPVFVVLDQYWIGFFVGCFFSVLTAFFVLKIVLTMWMAVKW